MKCKTCEVRKKRTSPHCWQHGQCSRCHYL